MLYKDYNLFLVIKPDTEHEGALITTEPKSPLNIFLEVSNKKYEVCNKSNHIYIYIYIYK